MIGTIEQVTLAKTGKSYRVKLGNEWVGAKKDSGIDMSFTGKTIEAEISDGDYGKWIEKWKIATAAQTVAATISADGINLAYLPFVSNCVAHAIQSGQCEGPANIAAWANAAYTAASNLKNAAE